MSATSGKQALRNAVAQTNIDMAGFQLTNLDATNLTTSLPIQGSNSGKFLTTNGTTASWSLLPSGMGAQSANTLVAGPTSGSAASPSFRTLVAADVPAIDAAKITTGALTATVGGTGQGSYTIGDVLYADTTTTLAKLGVGTVGSFLRQGASVPVWSTIKFASDSISQGNLLVGSTNNTISVIASIVPTGYALLSAGSELAPIWGKVTSAHADTSLLKSANNLSDVGTVATARNNILPTQTSNSGKFLTSDGTNASWATVAGSGTFASFAFTNGGGFVGAVVNPTTAPALSLTLGDSADTTKTATFDCSNVATSTNRVVNVPNANSTTAQTNAGASHNFLTAMSAQGVFSRAQPAVADVSDFNAKIAPAFITLTDGATITWTMDATKVVQNAVVTLGGNRALAFSGIANGMSGVLKVIQDGTGSRTLGLPAGSKVVNNGSGAITLTTAAGAIDLLGWIYDGSAIVWTILYNFT